jgi:hypothetical protein
MKFPAGARAREVAARRTLLEDVAPGPRVRHELIDLAARRRCRQEVTFVDDQPPDLFAQVQAEAATTWRSPATATSHIVRGSDRDALERLCRYGARPAFAHDRLVFPADGRISYQLKRPWPDGRTHLVLEPVAFFRRLVGIIPRNFSPRGALT